MTDTELLMSKICESGYKYTKIAQEIGVTRQGLWKKIHNHSEFKQSEIEIIAQLLKLDVKTRNSIFFNNFVGKSTTKREKGVNNDTN